MERLLVGDRAPDFALPGHTGEILRLSELCSHKNVVLVFNLGFA